MEITEVKVRLVRNRRKNDKLKAFCSVIFDNDFVIKEIKVIQGSKGLFVAMPSRKITEKCTGCGSQNYVRDRFCSNCGARLTPKTYSPQSDPKQFKSHVDIAHPINSKFREIIQKKIIEAYTKEANLPQQPPIQRPKESPPNDIPTEEQNFNQ